MRTLDGRLAALEARRSDLKRLHALTDDELLAILAPRFGAREPTVATCSSEPIRRAVMLASLRNRLAALEAVSPAQSPEEAARAERFQAAIGALFDAYTERGPIRPERTYMEDNLHALLERLDAGTETDDDRAKLGALPACRLTPHELVRECVEVFDSV